MKVAKLWVLLGVMLAGSFPVLAQSNPDEAQGLKPYDSFHGGDLDSVALTNGGLMLHIPLASFPQRGHLDLGFMVRYSNKQWRIKTHCTGRVNPVCTRQWVPASGNGVQIGSSVDWVMQSSYAEEPQDPNISSQPIFDWSKSVASPDGGGHQLGGGSDFNGPVYPLRSWDATGLLQPNAQTLILPNGTVYSYPTLGDESNTEAPSGAKGGVLPSTITDSNGNQITVSSTGWTDTMGRVIPGSANPSLVSGIQPGVPTTDLSTCPTGTSSALIWNIPGYAGVNSGVRTFKFCYSMVTLSTNFGGGFVTDYPPTSTSLLGAVVLPDLTMWTFAYDNLGDITRVGFPTGGSLAYTYTTSSASCAPGSQSEWVATRTVDANDGTGGHTWNYHYALSGGNLLATVTSPTPDSNDTVHTMGAPVSGACGVYDVETQYFQGSATSGTLLKTIQTQYSGNAGSDLLGYSPAINVVPTQVTVSIPGGLSSHSVSTYDTPAVINTTNLPIMIGSLLQRDDYDFSGSLVRSTVNHFLWQDNATYKADNFVSLPASSTLKNGGGTQVAQTTYTYDQGTLAPSGIGLPTHVAPPAGEPYRGNLTTTSHWLDTTSSFISSTATYLNTGMRATSTDPLLHSTSYTYDPMFLGTYLTQTNLPDTQMPDAGAPVVHHIIAGSYDFSTGLLTYFTDENGQTYTYSYDIMLRLAQGNHPDGGVTKFLYPDSNTVERQRLITGATYDDYKVKFDGLGRPYQTQQLTPDCAGYIKVDTTYDVVGRAKTVSNPYCLTSEPTYGTTQSTYDALSRTTQTTKQDGSFTTVKYEDTPGDTSGAPLVCTTATDESGKKRQACSDALGRLVKVVEPNPGSTATNATGSVTISGTEQTANSQLATPGKVTLTIGGTEQSVCAIGTCPPHNLFIFDSGTVTVTVNGVPVGANYSHTVGTDPLVASALKTAINLSTTIPVTASCNDGTCSDSKVNLTAKTSGASTNYSFSTSAATSDGVTNFFVASFHASPSSGALTGGQNASSTPDTGSVTITVDGTAYSTTYGSADTYATIASNLATAITAGPYATATVTGGTINLTSKTAGTAGDFSLAASYTWNTAQFVGPSFTASPTTDELSGGKDASGLNNNPFVTIYQYDARGDMLCVHQKATDTTADVACTGSTPPVVPASWRQRFFTYDSFSRLLTAMNPELNSTGNTVITYNYDNGSRLTSKVEPAPNAAWGSASTVTVNYSYDALNRLLDTTYSDGTTQGSSHRYDYGSFLGQTFTNSSGREVAATAAGNTIQSFASYDVMGRVTSTVQCNPGVTGCKTFTASYDKLGDLTTLGYPGSGFSVTYGYDSAARLTSATDSNGVIYAQTPTFIANGAIKEFTSPNFNNNKYHTDYNNCLQPVEVWTGGAKGTALFDKQYSYGATGTNNGNIYTITNIIDSTRTQSFTYDPLNRLLGAGDQTHWSNSYVYDAWGNLTNKTPGAPAGENMNKTADTNNHLSGLTYDAGGNVINDGLGGVFTFDGENRIKTAGSVTYVYDADGRRVQKSTGPNYWYGPGGQAFAETDSSGNWTNYIFFGGRRLARNVPQISPNPADIKYYITDHLHSTTMFVDKAGTTAAILDDNDMYPWGGIVPGVGQTTSNNMVKFTGQYRDTESQLDYLNARYYSNINGRFMSPDPLGGHQHEPQTLNKYSYAANSPETLTDPTGLDFALQCDGDSESCQGGVQGKTVSMGGGNWQFQETVIGNDSDGNLVDKTTNTGTYTATIGGAGVSFTQAGSSTSSLGQFINGTPPTIIEGQGALAGFEFRFTYSNANGNITAGGTFRYQGTVQQTEAALEKAGFVHYSSDEYDIFHPSHPSFHAQDYRSPGDTGTGADSGHFTVHEPWMTSWYNVLISPTDGDVHLGEHNNSTPGGYWPHFWEVLRTFIPPASPDQIN